MKSLARSTLSFNRSMLTAKLVVRETWKKKQTRGKSIVIKKFTLIDVVWFRLQVSVERRRQKRRGRARERWREGEIERGRDGERER